MANKLDSTSLFLAQVNQHAEALGGLLSCVAQDAIDADLIGRCIVSTDMLSKSASLMELSEWQASLDAFASLLRMYRDRRLPWDETIAEITSEIIEKEDLLVASAGGAAVSSLDDAVSAEELQALCHEVSELLETAAEAPAGAESGGEGASLPKAEKAECRRGPGEAAEPDAGREPDSERPESRDPHGSEPILVSSMPELRRHTQALLETWESLDWTAGHDLTSALDDMRKKLLLIGFYALSMERVVGARVGGLPAPVIDTLAPLRIAVHDYTRVVSAGTDRQIDLTFSAEDRAMDARLLQPIHRILQHLVGDVFLRCRETCLRIEVSVEEKNGALFWTLRDNGENFVADSHLDRDEYLAFYPGLRETRKILGELRSLLWVEPDGSLGTRFAFTTPGSLQDCWFMVWGTGGDGVAVLSSQLGDVHRVEDIRLTLDSHGERATVDGRQVRVVRLGQVYPKGCIDGDRIVVIGSLEKRIAFYMEGDGRLEKGVWKQDGITVGRGMGNGMVQIGDTRVPLVEADGLLQKYMATVDAISEEDLSGGVDVGVSDPSHTQAKKEKDAKTPPESAAKKGEVDVLVVEQNETLRRTLSSMLSQGGFTTRTVDGLEAALAFLDKERASVIISDFRVPSMSAKAVVDRLRRESRKIPVLVTTSHRGKNAEVLVERLGVSGYISKPLNPDEILSQIAGYAGRPVGEASRRS